MEHILWIGSPFFSDSLEDCGWPYIKIHNFEDNVIFCWDDLVKISGFTPEVLVVADKSRPPFILGMEKFPCLTVFYSVDSHIHSWQPLYAQGFDICLVSLKDHMQKFISPYMPKERIFWSPPFAKNNTSYREDIKKEHDCLFVGTVSENTPKRKMFLDKLKERFPSLSVMQGNYIDLFPRGRILLNHCEHDDLNFRVFEALGCGGCLVTPRVEHGMHKLFVDGEHLVGYVSEDVGDALFRIKFLLEEPELIEYIGKTGMAEINAKHRAIHRCQAFTDNLCDIWMQSPETIIANRQKNADIIRENYLKIPYLLWANQINDPLQKEAFLAAAKGNYGLSGLKPQ